LSDITAEESNQETRKSGRTTQDLLNSDDFNPQLLVICQSASPLDSSLRNQQTERAKKLDCCWQVIVPVIFVIASAAIFADPRG